MVVEPWARVWPRLAKVTLPSSVYLQLRRRDYLKDLAEQINVLNQSLKAKDIVIADAVARLGEVARAGGDPRTSERVQDIAADLADVVLPVPEEGTSAGPG